MKTTISTLPLRFIYSILGFVSRDDDRVKLRLPIYYSTYRSLWGELRNQLNRLLGIPRVYLLQTVHIESTNFCNFRCLHCTPQSIGLEKGMMEFSLFKKIVDQLTDLRVINLSWNGEPLLHKKIFDMATYARNRGVKVVIYTNGSALNAKNSEKIFNSGMSEVCISLDGVENEYTYNRGFDYQKIKSNILYLLELKKKLKSSLIVQVVAVGLDASSKRAVLREWDGKVDNVHFGNLMWSGTRKRQKSCRTMFREVTISWDGVVGPCCVDMRQSMAFGDLTENENIMDVVNGEKAQEYRQQHINKQFFGECETCDSYYG